MLASVAQGAGASTKVRVDTITILQMLTNPADPGKLAKLDCAWLF